jgi:hypothetical protein
MPQLAYDDRVLGVEVAAPPLLSGAVFRIVPPGAMMFPRVENDDR